MGVGEGNNDGDGKGEGEGDGGAELMAAGEKNFRPPISLPFTSPLTNGVVLKSLVSGISKMPTNIKTKTKTNLMAI